MNYEIAFSSNAKKQLKVMKQTAYFGKLLSLLNVIEENPYKIPPEYEKLTGDLIGYYSRRISLQHRLVYKVNEASHKLWIVSVWSHYE